mgnify:CR=1 FL=1
MMREHEHRHMIGRLVAPPALPTVVGPRSAHGTEHVAAENPGADILEAARDAAQALLQSKPGVVELHLQRWLGGRGEFLKV